MFFIYVQADGIYHGAFNINGYLDTGVRFATLHVRSTFRLRIEEVFGVSDPDCS